MTSPLRSLIRAVLPALCSLLLVSGLHAANPAAKTFNIPVGDARETLKQYQTQSGSQLLYPGDAVEGVKTNSVRGEMLPAEALNQMFAGTNLVVVKDSTDGSLTIRKETTIERKNVNRAVVQDSGRPERHGKNDVGADGNPIVKLDSFEVFGKKTLNMDVVRSPDDPQPRVIFNKETIDHSGATSINDFLTQRLPMNTAFGSPSQSIAISNSAQAVRSGVNLRGLGTNQTLILVDGHRIAGGNFVGGQTQPDLNAIPIDAVDRIEVLPTTASGIYGGGATGGVINIILKRGYTGSSVRLFYESAVSSDSGTERVDFAGSYSSANGRTNILVSGSYGDGREFVAQDATYLLDGRNLILHNNPAFYTTLNPPLLGYTTNIRSATGTALILRSTGQSLLSPFTYIPVGYIGTQSDQGAALLTNAGKYNLDLAATAQNSGGRYQRLISTPKNYSANATFRHSFTSKIEAFLDLNTSVTAFRGIVNPISGSSSSFRVLASAPNNPFTQDILVTTPIFGADTVLISNDRAQRLVAGVIVDTGHGWKTELDYTYNGTKHSDSTPSTSLKTAATSAVSSGTLDVLKDTNAYPVSFAPYLQEPTIILPVKTALNEFAARASGPISFFLESPATLSALASHRIETAGDYVNVLPSDFGAAPGVAPARRQSVTSGYLEAELPIVISHQHIPLLNELQVQLALRDDDYTVRASPTSIRGWPAGVAIPTVVEKYNSFDQTFALKYKPVADLILRASYGTGFLPPGTHQLVPDFAPTPVSAATAAAIRLTDPKRGGETLGAFDYMTGGNPNLKPEDSKTASVGVVFEPKWISGLRVSVDWSRIRKRNNITSFSISQTAINNEDYVSGLIVRAPAANDGFSSGKISAINGEYVNIARTEVETYDISAEYRRPTKRLGTFDMALAATRMMHYRTQSNATAPIVENVGDSTFGGINVTWRGTVSVAWEYRSFSLGGTARYIGWYWVSPTHQINVNQGAAQVPSQVYGDVFLAYKRPLAGAAIGSWGDRLLKGVDLQVGCKNFTNERPPLLVSSVTSNMYSAFGDPRGAVYYLSVRRSF